jgi:hypothetical protein
MVYFELYGIEVIVSHWIFFNVDSSAQYRIEFGNEGSF